MEDKETMKKFYSAEDRLKNGFLNTKNGLKSNKLAGNKYESFVWVWSTLCHIVFRYNDYT